jgi:hypothetical protein
MLTDLFTVVKALNRIMAGTRGRDKKASDIARRINHIHQNDDPA